jgi:hypothetical protein
MIVRSTDDLVEVRSVKKGLVVVGEIQFTDGKTFCH